MKHSHLFRCWDIWLELKVDFESTPELSECADLAGKTMLAAHSGILGVITKKHAGNAARGWL